jgi:hypothetical protein
MIVNIALKTVVLFILIADSAYGFDRTCVKVYNATSPTKALVAGVKGIVIDCTPTIIKYLLLLLCAGAIACGGAGCVTDDPNFAVGAFECCSAIMEGET